MKKLFILIILCYLSSLFAQSYITPIGEGTPENPYQISSLENLYWITIRDTVDNLSYSSRMQKHYIQTCDIDAQATSNSTAGWLPIGYDETNCEFRGSYDGQNFTIYNLMINRPNTDHIGLFGIGGTLKNLSLEDYNITGSHYVGALVGESSSVIENIHVNGNLSGEWYVGGIVGSGNTIINSSSNSVIINSHFYVGGIAGVINNATNCYSTANVIGHAYVGGIAGAAGGVIDVCFFDGSLGGIAKTDITNEKNNSKILIYYFGGIVGFNRGLIKNSYNLADLGYRMGGIVGYAVVSSLIINCYNYGNDVSNENYPKSAGIVFENNGYVRRCHNMGDVGSGICYYMEGLSLVKDCYSFGNCETGIVSYVSEYAVLEKSYSCGVNNYPIFRSATSYALIRNCVWNNELSSDVSDETLNNYASHLNIISANTQEMKDISTYTAIGWDFDSVWAISDDFNEGYPYLQWQNEPTPIDDEEIITLNNDLDFSIYPNPFNPETNISLDLKQQANVNISIYNIKGQLIKTVINGSLNPQKYNFEWDGYNNFSKSVSSGIYFCKVSVNNQVIVKRMLLLK